MMKIHKSKPNHIIEESYLDQSTIISIEPCKDYLIIYFKDKTYKKVDKITFE